MSAAAQSFGDNFKRAEPASESPSRAKTVDAMVNSRGMAFWREDSKRSCCKRPGRYAGFRAHASLVSELCSCSCNLGCVRRSSLSKYGDGAEVLNVPIAEVTV